MAAATTASSSSTAPGLGANMNFLFSEPLLTAALAQISTLAQFQALQENFRVAEESGKDIPDAIRAKLSEKRKSLYGSIIEESSSDYLTKSGLGSLVSAKSKWDDVHFMAEAHGVGSSIPMVSYTGLEQAELETGMNAFYEYIASTKVPTGDDDELRQEVCAHIVQSYNDLHESATGEFGGYEPFQTMIEHTPEKVKEVIMC